MNLPKIIAFTAFTAIAFTGLPGCYKAYDYINHHKGDDVSRLCRIEKMVFNNDANTTVTISYNANNDPISMKQGNTMLFIPLEYYFRYDRQNRLTDYMLVYYGMTGAMIWHRYSYPDKTTIIDTSFNYVGLITDPEPPHSASSFGVRKFNLDSWGRIIKSTDMTSLAVTAYTYDARGNLIRPGMVYDDKINILRTSKIWMLTRADYSMNNPIPATATIDRYNGYGLPMQYTSLAGSEVNQLFNYYYTNVSVVYTCDCNVLPSK